MRQFVAATSPAPPTTWRVMTSPKPPTSTQTKLLVAAAAGLLLGSTNCGDDGQVPAECPAGGHPATGGSPANGGGQGGVGGQGGAGPDEKVVLSAIEDKTVRFASFKDDCEGRGGFIQTHAVCAGNNACKGVSYNKYDFVLTEHTCSAMNTCGGMSCVVLPEDQGRTAEELYDATCAGCHGAADTGFVLYVPPGTDLAQAQATLSTKPRDFIHSAVAFGISSRSSNGVSAANMPPYHKDFSRAEVERVVEYALTLDLSVEEYGILGVNEEVNPN